MEFFFVIRSRCGDCGRTTTAVATANHSPACEYCGAEVSTSQTFGPFKDRESAEFVALDLMV